MQAIQFYIESKKKAETISYYNNKYNKKTTQNTLKNRLDIQTVFLVGFGIYQVLPNESLGRISNPK